MMIGIQNVSDAVPVYWVFTLLFLFLFAQYDYRHHLIRNKALLAFLLWCLLYIPIKAMADADVHWLDLTFHALLGGTAAFWFLAIIALLSEEGIGGGDIKLVTILAIVLGTAGTFCTLLLSSMVALLHVGIKEKIYKVRQERIAFAPYLFFGSLPYIFVQIIT